MNRPSSAVELERGGARQVLFSSSHISKYWQQDGTSYIIRGVPTHHSRVVVDDQMPSCTFAVLLLASTSRGTVAQSSSILQLTHGGACVPACGELEVANRGRMDGSLPSLLAPCGGEQAWILEGRQGHKGTGVSGGACDTEKGWAEASFLFSLC